MGGWRPRHDNGARDQLGRGGARIKIAAHAIHRGLWENCVESEGAIRLRPGMIVQEILQVLADQKHVEEFIVNYLEMIYGLARPRICDAERELNFVAGVETAR